MQTVLVTGDSRGLGAEVVEVVLEETPYSVVGVSRAESEATRAAEANWPERYTHVDLDLSNVAEIPDRFREEIEPHGPVYGFVSNAATGHFDPLEETTVDDVRYLFDVNVLSAVVLTKLVAADMEANGTEGSLVYVSSIATKRAYHGLSSYGATKGALEAFASGVARELGPKGIRANCVAPGFMETDMTAGLDEEVRERIYASSGLQEPTSERSVAETVAFLLSPDSRSITGEVVRVDAGL